MHVPWAWIKQRPHFFAESLNDDFDLKVFFKKPLKVAKNNLINGKGKNMFISSFFIFPFQRIPLIKKIPYLHKINDLLVKFQLPSLSSNDIIWVTNLSMYYLIYKILPSNTKLVYDCMDDELEFPTVKSNEKMLKEAILMEKLIMKRADVVLCSSEYLKNKIIKRSGVNREIIVVNNAIGIPSNEDSLTVNGKKVENQLRTIDNIFLYVGAISEWFDFETILFTLEKDPHVNFVLLGPKDVELPKHDRLHHLGSVARSDIFKLMKNVKGLIMPFTLNELIKSVNPVKLYEYIYMSKPIIATRYSETEYFEDYIYLYEGKDEFCSLIGDIQKGELVNKKDEEANKEFALDNSWNKRYALIRKHI
jgi:hypothetical protein